jgi:cytochrome oxidase assembly protein ShyY1
MRRIPVIATLVVVLAVATMMSLGLWQIRRAHWKEGLLASYQAAAGAPALDGIPEGATVDALAFRRAHLFCTITTPATQLGGASGAGGPGFRNVVGCRLADGRVMMADIGWSAINAKPAVPQIGQKVEAAGRLIPDEVLARRIFPESAANLLTVLVVMDVPVAGFQPSIAPSIADIPNNHRAYAAQWFLFAATATIIFLLALRRRNRAARPE